MREERDGQPTPEQIEETRLNLFGTPALQTKKNTGEEAPGVDVGLLRYLYKVPHEISDEEAQILVKYDIDATVKAEAAEAAIIRRDDFGERVGIKPKREDGALALPGVLVSDVRREKIRWLWPGRLALGKITILDGDPGLGKSTLELDLAARITIGGTWPDGTPIYEPGNVVIVTVEDGIGDTIRPRLEEAGADVIRVRVIQLIPEADGPGRVPTLPEDTELIMKAAEADGARLVVIDPLFAHLGAETNSYRDQDVRRALAPLSEAAERAGVAVLVVRHLNKSGGGKAMYRGGGSIGIIGAARIGLMVGEDPDAEGVCVLASTKNNLAAKPYSLAFSVVSSPNDPDVAVIRWEGTSRLTADELCRAPAGPSKLDDAERWLEEYLATGSKPSAEIFERGEEEGYSKNTLYRAKKILDIEAKKLDFDGGWEWKLPTLPEGRLTQDEPKALIPKVEHLRGSSAGENGVGSSNLTDGSHETPGGDGESTDDEPAFAWDEDDQGGDPK